MEGGILKHHGYSDALGGCYMYGRWDNQAPWILILILICFTLSVPSTAISVLLCTIMSTIKLVVPQREKWPRSTVMCPECAEKHVDSGSNICLRGLNNRHKHSYLITYILSPSISVQTLLFWKHKMLLHICDIKHKSFLIVIMTQSIRISIYSSKYIKKNAHILSGNIFVRYIALTKWQKVAWLQYCSFLHVSLDLFHFQII